MAKCDVCDGLGQLYCTGLTSNEYTCYMCLGTGNSNETLEERVTKLEKEVKDLRQKQDD